MTDFLNEKFSRRELLKRGALGGLSLGLGLAAMQIPAWFYRSEAATANDARMIVVFLRGAVDGLSVVVPYKDSNYYSDRPQIAIPASGASGDSVIPLDNRFGLHPALQSVMPMWQQGTLAFVPACGSPSDSRSHFDAQDYMECGEPDKKIDSGWMNRLMDVMPLTKTPTSAVSFGTTVPLTMKGHNSVANISVQGKKIQAMATDRPLIHQAFDMMYSGNDPLSQNYKEGLEARQTLLQYLNTEMAAADNGAANAQGFPSYAARIGEAMAKDPSLKLAFTDLGGWDTHVNQGSSQGQLAGHLTALSEGLAQIVQALGSTYANTTIIVMSEFGRTVKENGNRGTDHGHGNVMWVMGGGVKGGKVYGDWRGLTTSALYQARDVAVTTDFRSVLSMALTRHLGVAPDHMASVFPGFTPDYGPIQGMLTA